MVQFKLQVRTQNCAKTEVVGDCLDINKDPLITYIQIITRQPIIAYD